MNFDPRSTNIWMQMASRKPGLVKEALRQPFKKLLMQVKHSKNSQSKALAHSLIKESRIIDKPSTRWAFFSALFLKSLH